jgi:ankyrin repeat protein
LYSKNGDTLFHRLISDQDCSIDLKIKLIYILSDAGVDINYKNSKTGRTCLHLAVINGQPDLVSCLLQNGADLTITDSANFCAYNFARHLEDKQTSKVIITRMQNFYPTYWIGIDNKDMTIIRRLANSWCNFNVKKNGKLLIEYAAERKFTSALELFLSLEGQMQLCFAVLACNVKKVKLLMKKHKDTLRMDFKNMKENGANIFYYTIKQNNLELFETIFENNKNVLGECITDKQDIDHSIYFTALSSHLSDDCLLYLTPPLRKETMNNELDISLLFYQGKSILRFSIEQNLNINILRILLSSKYSSSELITTKDPQYLTSREYAIREKKIEYSQMIDQIIIDMIMDSSRFRKQLALNGFDFIINDHLKKVNYF